MTPASFDAILMRTALALARRGEGLTRPNPPVGAVVADANGRILAEAWHRGAGQPHAEAEVLDRIGIRAKGATLWVTLEPCCTWGRTPPCVDRIIAAGIRRVMVGAVDPNPRHQGKGLRRLRRAGIEVVRPPGTAAEAEALVAPFGKWVQSGIPWLTLKLGTTMDGRIADARGVSQWITGPAARKRVQALRQSADAILIGAQTVRADNPSLVPRPARGRKPWRVVVDTRGTLPVQSNLLVDAYAGQTIVATTPACPDAVRARYASRGAQVWVCRASQGQVSLRDLARRLGRLGVLHVLCEGGGRLAAALVQGRWVDAVEWFLAPRLLGSGGAPSIGALPWLLDKAPALEIRSVERIGPDVHIRGLMAGGPTHPRSRRNR